MITFTNELGDPLFSADGVTPRVGEIIYTEGKFGTRKVIDVSHKYLEGSPRISSGKLITRVYTERVKD